MGSGIIVPGGVLFNDVGGEAVLLNLETGKYYGLDEVGTRMWSVLTDHGQVALAYEALADEFDVTKEQLRQDLLNLVDELVTHGLVEVVGGEQDG
jgi:hypothetical protein